MKKSLFLILLLSIELVSCKESTEDKIKDGFNAYANKNFDNPNALESIVDINCIDTLSWNKLAKCSNLCIKNFNILNNRNFVLDSVFKNSVLNDITTLNYHQLDKTRKDFLSYNEICEEYDKFDLMQIIPIHESTIEKMKKLINQRENINYLVYQIRYRIKINEFTKHLDTCYCYMDNKYNLAFRKTHQLEEIPIKDGSFKQLFMCNRDYMIFENQCTEIIKEKGRRLDILKKSIFLAKQ